MQKSNPSSNSQSSGWAGKVGFLFVLAAVVAVAMMLRSGPNLGERSPAHGKPAPRLDLVRLANDSEFDRLNQMPPREVWLIHFWGTWCGPCKLEYPDLAKMVNGLESQENFRFVSVSCEYGSGESFDGLREKTADYLSSHSIAGSVYCDPQQVTRRSVAERLERPSMFYPTSLVIGQDGRIAGVWEGYAEESVGQIEATLRQELNR